MLNTEPTADITILFQITSDKIYQGKQDINSKLSTIEPLSLIFGTMILMIVVYYGIKLITGIRNYCRFLKKNLSISVFNLIMLTPWAKSYIQQQARKLQEAFTKEWKSKRKNQVFKLPEQPWKEETILNRMQVGSEMAKHHYIDGKMSGGVYTADDQHWDFITKCMRMNIVSNPLHMMEFSNIGQLEAEIIRMTLELFNGNQDSCGLTTSGGTESILVAMLAYREWGRARGIKKPNIVATNTAHAAFDKGCFYFGMELRKVPHKNFLADVEGMRKLIDSNTVCVVASSPDYAYGNFDPVPTIAAMAKELGTNCHSDCCLGSYINPFTEPAGFKLPNAYDFSVDGVTSISCDPHKFCYGPKGLSIIMFRTKELRRYTFAAVSDWPGGMYLTPSLSGSRSGATIAGTWAALMKQGREGFTQKAKNLIGAANQLKKELAKFDAIQVTSIHDTSIVSLTSDKINCIALQCHLKKKYNWGFSPLQLPASIHLVITDALYKDIDKVPGMIKEGIQYLLDNPELNNKGDAATYGMAESIPNKSIVGDFLIQYVEAAIDIL